MKSENAGSGKTGSGLGGRQHGRIPVRIPQIPMEWMDPMSWRLPSGKALAEFALQAGFLAPLMLSSPLSATAFKKPKKAQEPAVAAGSGVDAGIEKQAGEGPEQSGTFR